MWAKTAAVAALICAVEGSKLRGQVIEAFHPIFEAKAQCKMLVGMLAQTVEDTACENIGAIGAALCSDSTFETAPSSLLEHFENILEDHNGASGECMAALENHFHKLILSSGFCNKIAPFILKSFFPEQCDAESAAGAVDAGICKEIELLILHPEMASNVGSEYFKYQFGDSYACAYTAVSGFAKLIKKDKEELPFPPVVHNATMSIPCEKLINFIVAHFLPEDSCENPQILAETICTLDESLIGSDDLLEKLEEIIESKSTTEDGICFKSLKENFLPFLEVEFVEYCEDFIPLFLPVFFKDCPEEVASKVQKGMCQMLDKVLNSDNFDSSESEMIEYFKKTFGGDQKMLTCAISAGDGITTALGAMLSR